MSTRKVKDSARVPRSKATQRWKHTHLSAQTDSGALIQCGISSDLWPGSLSFIYVVLCLWTVSVPAEQCVCQSVPSGSAGWVENYWSRTGFFCLFVCFVVFLVGGRGCFWFLVVVFFMLHNILNVRPYFVQHISKCSLGGIKHLILQRPTDDAGGGTRQLPNLCRSVQDLQGLVQLEAAKLQLPGVTGE